MPSATVHEHGDSRVRRAALHSYMTVGRRRLDDGVAETEAIGSGLAIVDPLQGEPLQRAPPPTVEKTGSAAWYGSCTTAKA
jgi:hypothetical protein